MAAKKNPISLWDSSDQPREKLLKLGAKNLTNSELLAILLRTGGIDFTAVDLAHELWQHYHCNMEQLQLASYHQLIKFKGVGKSKAVTLLAAFELGIRVKHPNKSKKGPIRSSRAAFDCLKHAFMGIGREEFWVLHLSQSHGVIEMEQLSKGGMTSTLVDIRLLLRKALEVGAVALIVAHNHPSGNLEPSRSDIALTKKIKKATASLDIELLDHLIVSGVNYFSFADESLL